MTKTRQIILELLNRQGSLTLEAIARAAKHTPMAMRYHLAQMIAEGLLVTTHAEPRALVGRPQLLYTLADDAHEQLPKQYGWLAEQLLTEIERTCGAKETRALLRHIGRQSAVSAPPLRRGARIESRLSHVVDLLIARGFVAQWSKNDLGWQLDVRNCPYRQVARQHAAVCEIDLAFIGELLAAPMKMTHCIGKGDAGCQFLIKPPSASRKIG